MQVHFIVIAIIFAGLADLVYTQCDGDYDVRARTDSGWVCGKIRPAEDNNTYASFRGIRYGEPPLGKYRFSKLRPKVKWDGYFNAASEGPICPQYDDIYGKLVYPNKTMSEDCIRANVHVPEDALSACGHEINTEAKLPILVFVHGGGFDVGSGDSDVYGPEYLVSKGVIVITFNYRLNVMGFLSMHSEEIPGNSGLRDILTLLRWVYTNAMSFGGDPENITLAGVGTGATCAHLVSLSPQVKNKKMFKRLILLSGTANSILYNPEPTHSQVMAKMFLTYVGINSTDTGEIHKILTELPLSDIMEAYNKVKNESSLVAFCPTVESLHLGENRVLDNYPILLMRSGRGNEFPMLAGFTLSESKFFIPKLNNMNMLARIEQQPELLLPASCTYELPADKTLYLANKAQDRYFNGTPTLDGCMKFLTDAYFKYPAFTLAKIREEGGAPLYLYEYQYTAEYNVVKNGLDVDYTGVAHIEDLIRIFHQGAVLGNTSFSPDSDDYYMKEWMTSTIVDFMTCSAPCCTNSSAWQPSVNQSYQVVDLPLVYASTPPTPEQCDMVAFYQQLERDSCDVALTV